jgi:hypothetical protein
VVAARIEGAGGRIQEVVNTLRFISFNFGPTLLAWMETEAPETYQAILEADQLSGRALGGHGNAIAQPYHHSILPLASRRDKVTEVRWGVVDFRRRFRRDPVGMWLPETAVDAETLDVLAQEGIGFTIVAPHQVEHAPNGGMPGLYRTGSGKTVALFVYDGSLSHDVAFGPLLKDAGAWAERLAGKGEPASLVSMATDGETYGHHHKFGEMALAAVLKEIGRNPALLVENFASFLARNPPQEEVVLVEPSSWSCAHGVERWRGDCGCKMAPKVKSQQRWRGPLREAMEWLAGEIHGEFQSNADLFQTEPWELRNDYGRVVVGDQELDTFLDNHLHAPTEDRGRASALLELERDALRLFTSCGWFFDDLAGIESLQVLRYAAHALELLEREGKERKEGFLRRLQKGRSNEKPSRDGATLFRTEEEVRLIMKGLAPDDRGLAGALEAAISNLESGSDPLEDRIRTIRVLATHLTRRKIPIPFDAQTTFFRILERASLPQKEALSTLHEPLGFVSD